MGNLSPQISISEVGDSLVVKDTTGNYDATNNPGGYGAMNVIPQWITKATLYITPSRTNRQTYQKDVTGVMGAPNTAFQILPWDLGMQRIESELYDVRYVLSGTKPDGSTFSYETECDIVATHQAECCLGNAVAAQRNVPLDSVFKDERSRMVSAMSVLMGRAKDAIQCGDYEAADRMVYSIRLNCSCNC